MPVTVRTADPVVGQIVTINVRYQANPPDPNDVHVDVHTENGFVPVVGYDTFPPGTNARNGFDIPIPPTPQWATPGQHRFQLRWTRDGEPAGAEPFFVTTRPRPPRPSKQREWKWKVFWGKVVAGTLMSALGGIILNWWTGVGLLPCAVTGAAGGFGTGVLAYIVEYWFDEPRIDWSFESAFLFTAFWTLGFFMLFGILAFDIERAWVAQGEVWFNRVTVGVAFVATFLGCTLGGWLNNLRRDSAS